jgi:hypothetical protein
MAPTWSQRPSPWARHHRPTHHRPRRRSPRAFEKQPPSGARAPSSAAGVGAPPTNAAAAASLASGQDWADQPASAVEGRRRYESLAWRGAGLDDRRARSSGVCGRGGEADRCGELERQIRQRAARGADHRPDRVAARSPTRAEQPRKAAMYPTRKLRRLAHRPCLGKESPEESNPRNRAAA